MKILLYLFTLIFKRYLFEVSCMCFLTFSLPCIFDHYIDVVYYAEYALHKLFSVGTLRLMGLNGLFCFIR